MSGDPFLVFRVFAAVTFIGLLVVGAYVLKNFGRIFGPDPDMPSENASSRTYAAVLVVLVWIHAVVITGLVALGGH